MDLNWNFPDTVLPLAERSATGVIMRRLIPVIYQFACLSAPFSTWRMV